MTDKPVIDADLLRAMGKDLRPTAHDLANEYRRVLRVIGFADIDHVLVPAMQSEDIASRLFKTRVAIPVILVASAVAILLTLPRPRRGRPRKPSTDAALMLAEQLNSIRGAANRTATSTGEPPAHIRSRVQGVKRRAKKQSKKGG